MEYQWHENHRKEVPMPTILRTVDTAEDPKFREKMVEDKFEQFLKDSEVKPAQRFEDLPITAQELLMNGGNFRFLSGKHPFHRANPILPQQFPESAARPFSQNSLKMLQSEKRFLKNRHPWNSAEQDTSSNSIYV